MLLKTATSKVEADFARNPVLQGMAALYALIWAWAAWDPVYRFDWLLENLLTVVVVITLVLTYRRFAFSELSYLLLLLFLVLHAVGGHYTYSEVPLGETLKQALGLGRNHYDRMVHFAFGLLLAYPFYELVIRTLKLRFLPAALFAFALVAGLSSLFEVIEWLVAEIVDPEAGAAYLGTQGDEFDSQKDMALAKLGALLALALTWLTPSARPARNAPLSDKICG
jgi:putative membrane protein